MPDFLQFVSALKEQMSATLSRSDALRPLAWLIGILVLSFFGCLYSKPETWVFVCDVSALGLSLLTYIIAFAFFAVTDRDALRSEKYSLNKMAMEHGWRGDSITGAVDNTESHKIAETRVIGFEGDAHG